MILFCATAPTALSFAMTYKMLKHKDEETAILIHKKLYRANGYYGFLEKLVDIGVFSHILCQEKFLCLDKDMPNDGAMIEEKFTSTFDSIFQLEGMDIHDFENIYFISDDWNGDFGLYLYYKKVHYSWLGMPKGAILLKTRSFPSAALNLIIKETRAFSAVAEYAFPILHKGTAVEDVAVVQKYKGENIRFWDSREYLEKLSTEEINKVVECNLITPNDLHDMTMVLFNSCGYAAVNGTYINIEKRLRKQDHSSVNLDKFSYLSMMYALAMDIFMKADSKLFFKIHPNERLEERDFLKYFGVNAKSFPSIPFEFIILYIKRNKIVMDEFLSIDSTADKLIGRDSIKNITKLGLDFFKTWSFYISLYTAYRLYLSLKKPGYQLYTSKLLKAQVEKISRLFNDEVEVKNYVNKREIAKLKNAFVIVDETEKQLNKEELIEYAKTADVVLMNVELQNYSTQDELDIYDNASCIKICKKPIDMSLVTSQLNYDEYLWIRTNDKNKAQIINQFQYEMTMKCSNLVVSARKLTLQEESEYIRGKKNSYQLESMKKTLVRNDRIIKSLTDYMINEMDEDRLRVWLADIYDIEYYLEILSGLEKKYTVFLAVRDTPGSMMPAKVLEQIRNLGFHDFKKDLWMTYVGIVTGNHILCGKRGTAPEVPVNFDYEYHTVKGSHKFYLSSQAWRQGDKASIVINGKDYAVNMRGINIVVFNLNSGRILDSVGIDMHTADFKMVHM